MGTQTAGRRLAATLAAAVALSIASAGVASADEAPCVSTGHVVSQLDLHPRHARHGRHYIVRKGDTLWRIAVRFYGPGEHAGHQWKRIAKANHLKGSTIRVGQVLVIPRVGE